MSQALGAPRAVRLAGLLVGLQGLAGVVLVVALLVRALNGAPKPGNVFGEAGYFAILTAAVIATAVGLLRGKRWARSPAVVLQLLLLGVAWYTLGPSGRWLIGSLGAIYCVSVLVLLFSTHARAWVLGIGPYDDSADQKS
ncbi:hypothetical protein M8C13_30695 [Crossiella sp. SN42]|uniref:hypothetical protein n=1 Tax=Crossiella sp. SN42 TaxID=2944808 RepID=UPI00207CA88F|nr:hypothetical protein [Crossiella sp. SN42]MCO1580132.1 hypothetical protein [Crossiella sp. SN42]